VGRQLNNFETLKKENELSLVFKNGRTIKSTGYVKATYLFVDSGESKTVKSAIATPSRSGNSVWRNRFKRLIRESIKLESNIINEIIDSKNSGMLIVYSPHMISQKRRKKLFLNEIHHDVINILKNISSTIKSE